MWGLNDVLTYSIAYGMGEEEGKAKAEKEKKKDSPWHTGTPTEIGAYLVHCDNAFSPYDVYMWRNCWVTSLGLKAKEGYVIAWQKIEPYKEENNG